MKLLIIVGLFLIASTSWATNFNGIWSGPGTFESDALGPVENTLATVTIVQTRDSLYIKDCWKFKNNGINQKHCASCDLEIKGDGELWFQGFLTGKVHGNTIKIFVSGPELTIVGEITLQQEDTLNFFSETTDRTGKIKTEALSLAR